MTHRLDSLPLTLQFEHPEPYPKGYEFTTATLPPVPTKVASNRAWREFRDKFVIPYYADNPSDPNGPLFLAHVEKILTWRSTVPESSRFWRADEAEG